MFFSQELVRLKRDFNDYLDNFASYQYHLENRLDRLEYYDDLLERGLSESQIKMLGNLGYTFGEMYYLTKEELGEIFAPGALLDRVPMVDMSSLDNEMQEMLKKKDFEWSDVAILGNLGYSVEEIRNLSEYEIDFIFPNTELIDNLVKVGMSEEEIDTQLRSGKSYRMIIKEAIEKSDFN